MAPAPFTRTPNTIYEALPEMSEAEMRCTLALVRQTYGYHRDEVKATFDELQKWTGLSRQGVANGMAAVRKRGFFVPGKARGMWETVCEVDQNSQLSRPNEEEKQSTKLTETVYEVDQNSQLSRLSTSYPKEKEKKERKSKEREPAVTMPANLDTPEFREAWGRWKEYRQQIRKPLKPMTEKAQLKKAAAAGATGAIQVIDLSIENGWQGLFFERLANQQPGSSGAGKNGSQFLPKGHEIKPVIGEF